MFTCGAYGPVGWLADYFCFGMGWVKVSCSSRAQLTGQVRLVLQCLKKKTDTLSACTRHTRSRSRPRRSYSEVSYIHDIPAQQ